MSDRPTPPKRRLHLTLDLHADTLDDLSSALERIATDLIVGNSEDREVTSGGYTDGYHLKLTCDPDMTGDRYRAELEAWRTADWERRNTEARQ